MWKLTDNKLDTTSGVLTKLLNKIKNQYKMAMVNNWLKVNKFSLNIRKSRYMIFHTNKKKIQSLTLKIDNVNIERVAEFNFLGVTLDEHLTWKCHVNKISNKISQCKGILNRLKHFL